MIYSKEYATWYLTIIILAVNSNVERKKIKNHMWIVHLKDFSPHLWHHILWQWRDVGPTNVTLARSNSDNIPKVIWRGQSLLNGLVDCYFIVHMVVDFKLTINTTIHYKIITINSNQTSGLLDYVDYNIIIVVIMVAIVMNNQKLWICVIWFWFLT